MKRIDKAVSMNKIVGVRKMSCVAAFAIKEWILHERKVGQIHAGALWRGPVIPGADTCRSGAGDSVLSLAALAMLIWAGYRFFSRNVQKRYLENLHFMEKVGAVRNRSQMNKTKFDQRKDYKFFVCPNCKTNLRVPKGKGDIYITCSKCGTRFRGKS